MSHEILLTPYQWLTSDRPEAKEWRTEVAGTPAWGAVYDLAASQSPRMREIPLPATPIPRPPTTVSKFFNNLPAPKVAQSGKYFALPKREPAAVGKFFVIPREGK